MDEPRYYHGGVPDLMKGQMIRPPCETGVRSTALYGAQGVCNTSKVYVTTDKAAALLYAAGHPSRRGAVYEVEPIGDLTPDPDCKREGLSYECDSARIVQRLKVKGKLMRRARRALISPSSPWNLAVLS